MEREMEEMKIARKRKKINLEKTEEKIERGEDRKGEMEKQKERIKGLEKRWEIKEKGKRSIIIKRLKEREENLRKREALKKVGMEVKIEEVKKVEADSEEKGEIAIMRLKNERMRRDMLKNK